MANPVVPAGGGSPGRARARAAYLVPVLRMLARARDPGAVVVYGGEGSGGTAPDVLTVPAVADMEGQVQALAEAVSAWIRERSESLRQVHVQGTGSFGCGPTRAAALAALQHEGRAGHAPVAEQGPAAVGRLVGKAVLVTGGAQGFGRGLGEFLLREGASVTFADLNKPLAAENIARLRPEDGRARALALHADVTDEASVSRMIEETLLYFGGLDVLISNAGILRAGSLEEMDVETFEKVSRVNYTAFFVCARQAAAVMKRQHRFDRTWSGDIIQINSKSGLVGSNKNFAYAGSKFGSIGLVQSFALELVPYRIKVNAICPGNLFDGPLWSDPEKGLFRQYLDAGKVPGAKTLDDVRHAYEAMVPMRRGCTVEDVARAVFYAIEQTYETGQAIPVTGGQIILH
jgi:NAD(P)-dependent dehydrogenase (short-subunit alcohol dehydrogenase family)